MKQLNILGSALGAKVKCFECLYCPAVLESFIAVSALFICLQVGLDRRGTRLLGQAASGYPG